MSFFKRTFAGGRALACGPFWKRKSLLQLQTRQLKRLVRHAYTQIPLYQDLFDQAGITPDTIRNLEDLRKIPFTSRRIVQPFGTGDVATQGLNSSNLVTCSTSGSTGEPLIVKRTGFEETLLTLFRLRSLLQLGLRPWQKVARVAFYPETDARPKGPWSRLRLLLEISGRGRVHCQNAPREMLRRLQEIRPDVLRGYPSRLTDIANVVTDRDRDRLKPRLVITGAEILTSQTRNTLEETFRSSVLDLYGCHEFPLIAFECKHSGGYHLCEDTLIAEVLEGDDPVAPGEKGELVLTGLHSFAMPFIRYRTGDSVVRGVCPCPCGAQWATLTRIHGRLLDEFYFPDGSVLDASTADQNLRKFAPWVRRYQVVQDSLTLVTIKAEPWKAPDTETLANTALRIEEQLPKALRVRFQICDEIPSGPAGKFRLYRSELQAEDQKTIAFSRSRH